MSKPKGWISAILAAMLMMVASAPALAQSQQIADSIREGRLLFTWTRGQDVADWQRAVNHWLDLSEGDSAHLAVDGIYGPITRTATLGFQRAQNIAVDGIVGPQTRGAMINALGAADPPPGDENGNGGLSADEVLSPHINTQPDEGQSESPMVSVTNVRVGRHNGFDRVVFDIGGQGLAGWNVRYVDEARAAGSGFPIEVEGGAVLSVSLNNISLPPDAPAGIEPYDGPERIRPAGQGRLIEIVEDTVYEGHHTFFVGVTDTVPFQVRRLESPQRVVLDIDAR